MKKQSVQRGSRRVVLGLGVLAGLVHQAYAQEVPAVQADTSVVKVTGYRASLLSSAKDKQESVGFQDTISAEDIGKFPDKNIAESLSRVPGVQIARRDRRGHERPDPRPGFELHQGPAEQRPDRGRLVRSDRRRQHQPRDRPRPAADRPVHQADRQQEPDAGHARRRRRRRRQPAQRAAVRQSGHAT
jgi:hypothetical protein